MLWRATGRPFRLFGRLSSTSNAAIRYRLKNKMDEADNLSHVEDVLKKRDLGQFVTAKRYAYVIRRLSGYDESSVDAWPNTNWKMVKKVSESGLELHGGNHYLWAETISALRRCKKTDLCEEVYERWKERFPPGSEGSVSELVYNSMLSLYGQTGEVAAMLEVTRDMKKANIRPNLFSACTAISSMCRTGQVENAYAIYKKWVFVTERGKVSAESRRQLTRNDSSRGEDFFVARPAAEALIYGLCKRGDWDSAMGVYEDLLSVGVVPSSRSLSSLALVAAKKTRLEMVDGLLGQIKEIHGFIPQEAYRSVLLGLGDRKSSKERSKKMTKLLEKAQTSTYKERLAKRMKQNTQDAEDMEKSRIKRDAETERRWREEQQLITTLSEEEYNKLMDDRRQKEKDIMYARSEIDSLTQRSKARKGYLKLVERNLREDYDQLESRTSAALIGALCYACEDVNNAVRVLKKDLLEPKKNVPFFVWEAIIHGYHLLFGKTKWARKMPKAEKEKRKATKIVMLFAQFETYLAYTDMDMMSDYHLYRIREIFIMFLRNVSATPVYVAEVYTSFAGKGFLPPMDVSGVANGERYDAHYSRIKKLATTIFVQQNCVSLGASHVLTLCEESGTVGYFNIVLSAFLATMKLPKRIFKHLPEDFPQIVEKALWIFSRMADQGLLDEDSWRVMKKICQKLERQMGFEEQGAAALEDAGEIWKIHRRGELGNCKVTQIQEMLRKMGEPATGTKTEMVEKLIDLEEL